MAVVCRKECGWIRFSCSVRVGSGSGCDVLLEQVTNAKAGQLAALAVHEQRRVCSASIWMGRRGNLDGESVSRRSNDCRADCRAQEFC